MKCIGIARIVNFTPLFCKKKAYKPRLRIIRVRIRSKESINKITFKCTPKRFMGFKKIRKVVRVNKPTRTALII
jgi:hypothetical protein